MDKTVEAYLKDGGPVAWDYWQFNDDFDALREACDQRVVKWYLEAIEQDKKQYHNRQSPDFIAWKTPILDGSRIDKFTAWQRP